MRHEEHVDAIAMTSKSIICCARGEYLPSSELRASRQRELEEAAAAAERALAGREGRSGGSVSSRSGKAQKIAFGADDLLAALTWVVVQVRREISQENQELCTVLRITTNGDVDRDTLLFVPVHVYLLTQVPQRLPGTTGFIVHHVFVLESNGRRGRVYS